MKNLFVLPSLALLLVGLACQKKESPTPPALPLAKVRIVSSQGGLEAGWAAATLAASQRATLSTRMAASVKQVHANEGQRVAAGELLLSLSDEDLQGGLHAAETALAAAQVHSRRIENLAKQNAAIPAEKDLAETQLAQAQAALAQVKANLAYTRIRAPFAGVVQARRVNAGDFVGPGMPLLEIEATGALELQGSLTDAEAKSLRQGQKLRFQVDGQEGQAELSALASGGDPVSHRRVFRARVLSPKPGMRSGAFARIQLPGVQAASDLVIPRSALVTRGELNGVFLARNGKAELRWISLGEAQGDYISVRAGLSSTDSVIDKPGSLQDGQPIEVAK